MRPEEVIFILLLTIWWVISLCGQCKSGFMTRLRAQDVFHLIPNWRFFAPVPARRDYHLEYRTRSRAGRISSYRRIEFLRERDWVTTLWNPSKRLRKAFNTSVRRIVRCRSRFGERASLRCVAYLRLLNYLQSITADPNGYALQFRIVSAADFASDPRIQLTFRSEWHLIDTCD
jgi:hypothetical protein